MSAPGLIEPDWPAPPGVRAVVTTRAFGDLARGAVGMRRILDHVPAEPVWLRQVHGTTVVDAALARDEPAADASFARVRNVVCAVRVADCMPVLLADSAGSAVGVAHAGWRGLSAGVIENTVAAMRVPPERLLAWLGPAIGARVYEVGAEVRDAFLSRDAASESALTATRPGHWLLDLCAVARQRLRGRGVTQVYGGQFCTYSDPDRFYSHRRAGDPGRMAALVWLA